MSSANDDIFYKWANQIERLGLSTPVAFLLAAYKPLSFVTGQFIVVGQPMLNLFVAPHLTSGAIHLLTERSKLEAFIGLLEQD